MTTAQDIIDNDASLEEMIQTQYARKAQFERDVQKFDAFIDKMQHYRELLNQSAQECDMSVALLESMMSGSKKTGTYIKDNKEEQVPDHIFWDQTQGAFFDRDGLRMKEGFFEKWYDRRHEFTQYINADEEKAA